MSSKTQTTNLMHKKGEFSLASFFTGVLMGMILIILVNNVYDYQSNQKGENIKFYEEWCEKLNSTIVEPIAGYYYSPTCFIEKEGVVKFYYITEINGEWKLKEI